MKFIPKFQRGRGIPIISKEEFDRMVQERTKAKSDTTSKVSSGKTSSEVKKDKKTGDSVPKTVGEGRERRVENQKKTGKTVGQLSSERDIKLATQPTWQAQTADVLEQVGNGLSAAALGGFALTNPVGAAGAVIGAIGANKLADKVTSELTKPKTGLLTSEYENHYPTFVDYLQHKLGLRSKGLTAFANPATLIGGAVGSKGANAAKGLVNELIKMDMPRFGFEPTTTYQFEPSSIGTFGTPVRRTSATGTYTGAVIANELAPRGIGVNRSQLRNFLQQYDINLVNGRNPQTGQPTSVLMTNDRANFARAQEGFNAKYQPNDPMQLVESNGWINWNRSFASRNPIIKAVDVAQRDANGNLYQRLKPEQVFEFDSQGNITGIKPNVELRHTRSGNHGVHRWIHSGDTPEEVSMKYWDRVWPNDLKIAKRFESVSDDDMNALFKYRRYQEEILDLQREARDLEIQRIDAEHDGNLTEAERIRLEIDQTMRDIEHYKQVADNAISHDRSLLTLMTPDELHSVEKVRDLQAIQRDNPTTISGMHISPHHDEYSWDSIESFYNQLQKALRKEGAAFYKTRDSKYIRANDLAQSAKFRVSEDFDPTLLQLLKEGRGKLPNGVSVRIETYNDAPRFVDLSTMPQKAYDTRYGLTYTDDATGRVLGRILPNHPEDVVYRLNNEVLGGAKGQFFREKGIDIPQAKVDADGNIYFGVPVGVVLRAGGKLNNNLISKKLIDQLR